MDKEVLISIKPKWVKKILLGEKTYEIRKTKPKIPLPFTAYIYITKEKKDTFFLSDILPYLPHKKPSGTIIGEVIIDNIITITPETLSQEILEGSCLGSGEIMNYLRKGKGYAYHISQVKVYPKGLDIEKLFNYNKLDDLREKGEYSSVDNLMKDRKNNPEINLCKIKIAPQSWGYVYREKKKENI